MHVVSVVGARPQFVKLSPVHRALQEQAAVHTVVHSGQHYDFNMSDIFFRDLDLPVPAFNLGVGSASHVAQTTAIYSKLEAVLMDLRPDWVLTYGDTNTTLAASLASRQCGIPSAHIEAGLRSFVRNMPEELNRVVSDHTADLLFAPTPTAAHRLVLEGLGDRSVFTGDVMLDLLTTVLASGFVEESAIEGLTHGQYVVCTLHRPTNVDQPDRVESILEAVATLDLPTVLVAHPRLRAVAGSALQRIEGPKLRVHAPLPYLQTIRLLSHARSVITDSGGVQKEAYFLGVPCTTLRSETEWPETTRDGWNILAADLGDLVALSSRQAPQKPPDLKEFGGGSAARLITSQLTELM